MDSIIPVKQLSQIPGGVLIFTARKNSGYMLMEIIMALVVLSFIIRPVFVEHQNEFGERTTTVQFELPMAKMLDQVGNLKGLIDKSWANMDRQFGYHGNSVDIGRLMTQTLKHGVVLMTAGFVDQDGRWATDINNHPKRFENSAKGACVAFYDAARQGMRY